MSKLFNFGQTFVLKRLKHIRNLETKYGKIIGGPKVLRAILLRGPWYGVEDVNTWAV